MKKNEYEAFKKVFVNRERQKNAPTMEQSIIGYIEEGGETGLLKLIDLIDADKRDMLDFPNTCAPALAITNWGIKGLSQLVEFALNTSSRQSIQEIAYTLSFAASSSLNQLLPVVGLDSYQFPRLQERLNLVDEKYYSDAFALAAKDSLLKLVESIQLEELDLVDLISSLNMLLAYSEANGEKALNSLSAACSIRLLRIDGRVLNEYLYLLQTADISEQEVHMYLVQNPFLLDPFYEHIWSKEPLGERLEADFIIRLMDDSYIVVEIEKPSDPILNKKGDLSAQATHALRQALEYRSWIIRNHLYAKQRFENIGEPSCLVIIGLESRLSEEQRGLLRQQNERDNVKIVGFDWLYQRTKAVLNNLTKHGYGQYSI